MTYDNTNKGVLGKNTRKEQDTHPDITGSINVDGRDYWLNGWQKTNSKDGTTFYSLSVKPKEARQDAPVQSGGFSSGPSDDTIPFAPEWR
jgi:hypothetical protein